MVEIEIGPRPEGETSPDWRWRRYLSKRTVTEEWDVDEVIAFGLEAESCGESHPILHRYSLRAKVSGMLSLLTTRSANLGAGIGFALLNADANEYGIQVDMIEIYLYAALVLDFIGRTHDERWIREHLYIPALTSGQRKDMHAIYPMIARHLGAARFAEWLRLTTFMNQSADGGAQSGSQDVRRDDTVVRIQSMGTAVGYKRPTEDQARKLLDLAIGPLADAPCEPVGT